MEAGIIERARQSGPERLQAVGGELAALAVVREYRAAQAAGEIGPVLTQAAAQQLEASRRDIPAEASDNGMGI